MNFNYNFVIKKMTDIVSELPPFVALPEEGKKYKLLVKSPSYQLWEISGEENSLTMWITLKGFTSEVWKYNSKLAEFFSHYRLYSHERNQYVSVIELKRFDNNIIKMFFWDDGKMDVS